MPALLMIRPVNFTYNAQTAVNNAFQVKGEEEEVQNSALKEFDEFVRILRNHQVKVIVVDDTPQPHTPDSIFPNNWISFHENETIVLYPMFADNRRQERKETVLQEIRKTFTVSNIIDLSFYEEEGKFLEGTGSMVLDRYNKIAYACLSPRTDRELLEDFCRRLAYTPISFLATDKNGKEIYHTNVMMCVADKFIVICLDVIRNDDERNSVKKIILDSGKEIVEITEEQMNHFAGNMLQVKNSEGISFLVMSTQAYQSLSEAQLKKLSAFNPIIHSSLNTIESNGGGSARCMMAEMAFQS